MPITLAPAQQEEMLSAARDAFRNAHAPYSNFKVGATILTERGTMYHGCNVENASYGLTICAERNAIFAAVAAEGSNMRIQAVAVATERDGPCAPCGASARSSLNLAPMPWFCSEVRRAPSRWSLPGCCLRAFACNPLFFL